RRRDVKRTASGGGALASLTEGTSRPGRGKPAFFIRARAREACSAPPPPVPGPNPRAPNPRPGGVWEERRHDDEQPVQKFSIPLADRRPCPRTAVAEWVHDGRTGLRAAAGADGRDLA